MSSRFFVDRSLGGIVCPGLLRADGWDIITMSDFYGRRSGERILDVRWIMEQAGLGHALLSGDGMILSNPVERDAITESGAHVFVLPTSKLTGSEKAERFIRHRDTIHARAAEAGPCGFVVYETRISRALP